MDYQTGATTCPKCGSADQVRTARELFDALNGARDQAFRTLGQAPGQHWNSGGDDD